MTPDFELLATGRERESRARLINGMENYERKKRRVVGARPVTTDGVFGDELTPMLLQFVPIWGQTTLIPKGLPPKRDCSAKRVITM